MGIFTECGRCEQLNEKIKCLRGELEVLRGLLRECIEWVEFKEDGGLRYAHGAPELVRRVREVLGE
jgi:hypothetical protein